MRITKALETDLPEILQLQRLAYQSEAKLCNDPKIPPLMQTLEDIKEEYGKGIFLKALDRDNNIVASVRAYSENGTLFIGKLIVHPERQGQGIGTTLLKEMEQTCPECRYELFTSTKSERNIKLYERAGYWKFKEQGMGNNLNLVYLEKYSRSDSSI